MPFIAIAKTDAEAAPTIPDGGPLTSAGMTLADITDELTSMLGGRDDIAPSRLNRWINAAYEDIATSLKLSEMEGSYAFDLVVDQPLYLLPGAVLDVSTVSLTDPTRFQITGGAPLRNRTLEWYRRQIDNLTTKIDMPSHSTDYFVYNDILVVYPTPKHVHSLTVDFYIRPTKLAANTDSPILPVEWHWAIVLLSRSIAHSALQEYDLAAPAQNDYVNYVRRRTDRKAEQDDGRVALSSVPRKRSDLKRPERRSHNHFRDMDLD